MRSGALKYFLLALIFGLLAALGSFLYLSGQASEPGQIDMVEIPVATVDIAAYAQLKPSDLKSVKIPKEAVHMDAVMDVESLVGKYAGAKIIEGEQILSSRVRESIDDVLPSIIKDGYRAISIQTNEFQSVGDMLVSGDRVDLVVFLPEKTRQEVVIREDQAQIFVEDIKVLAVSRQTLPGQMAHEEVPDRYSVTLEVPVDLTKDIILAENIGVIKIILRGEKDKGRMTTPPVYWEDLQ